MVASSPLKLIVVRVLLQTHYLPPNDRYFALLHTGGIGFETLGFLSCLSVTKCIKSFAQPTKGGIILLLCNMSQRSVSLSAQTFSDAHHQPPHTPGLWIVGANAASYKKI